MFLDLGSYLTDDKIIAGCEKKASYDIFSHLAILLLNQPG